MLNTINILKDNDFMEQDCKELLELAENSGDILMALIGEVLDISKLQAGKLELDSNFENVRQLIVKALGLFYHKAKDKQLQLRLYVSYNLPSSVEIDSTRLSQV